MKMCCGRKMEYMVSVNSYGEDTGEDWFECPVCGKMVDWEIFTDDEKSPDESGLKVEK